MRLRYLAYAALALLVLAPAAFAQSIHTMPIGTEVEGKVRFARSEVPLPPGTWTLLSAGEAVTITTQGELRIRRPYATLARIEGGALAGLVDLDGTAQRELVRWPRERSCDRTDLLFVDADRNFNEQDQFCVYVSHTVRTWVAGDTASDNVKGLYAQLRERNVQRPTVMVTATIRYVQHGEFVRVIYETSPPRHGGPATRIIGWSTSEWHKDVIAAHPEHRRFADAWIDWAKAMNAKVKEGFGRTLAGFAPIEIAYARPGGTPAPAPAQAAARPPTPALAQPAAAPAARPLPPGHVQPAIGTRFVTTGGHFEIVRVDGMSIVTVNAGNSGATWRPGGLVALATDTKFDLAHAESIFPLSIGKKVEFVQSAATGANAWKQQIEVVREETLSIDGRAYRAFVVENRTEAVGPGMAEFVRMRTLWYAPDAGWLLRLREEQLAGAPQRMFNWDVVRIVPPS